MKKLIPALLLLTAFACQTRVEYAKLEDPLASLHDESLKPFYYGVASGDPLQDAVILWTKVNPEDSLPNITVCFELAEDEDFNNVVYSGCTETGPEDGYTVKTDADGLEAGTRYFYRFKYEDSYSPTGRTMTATANSTESLKFGVVSCSNYEFGPFNTIWCHG